MQVNLVTVELLPPAPRDPRAEPIAAVWPSGQSVVTGLARFGSASAGTRRYGAAGALTPNMSMAPHTEIRHWKKLPHGPTLWAEVPVTVTDRDVAVTVNLRAGSRVHGRVEFDGRLPPPSPERPGNRLREDRTRRRTGRRDAHGLSRRLSG